MCPYYNRAQQEIIDRIRGEGILQAFISGFFEKQESQKEADYEDESDDAKDDGMDSKTKKEMRILEEIKDSINSISLKFSNGAEPITLRNYLPLWLFLSVGFLLSGLSCCSEIICGMEKKRTKRLKKHFRNIYF